MTPARTAGEAHALMRALPFASAPEIVGGGTALLLAPHPDDESLGFGGLVARLCALGTPPLVAVLTDGAASHPGSRLWPPARLAALREQETREALAILGLPPDRVHFLGLPDTRAPSHGPAMEAAAARLAALATAHGTAPRDSVNLEVAITSPTAAGPAHPDVPLPVTAVIGPWRHDPHCDHEAAAAIAAHAAGLLGVPWRSYPVWGWTLPAAAPLGPAAGLPAGGWRLDVSMELPLKRRAVLAHRSQRGLVVPDDPSGFVLPEELLDVMLTPFEVFLGE